MKCYLLLLFAFFSIGLLADTVVQTDPKRKIVAVIFSEEKTFEIDQQVCLRVDDVNLACGDILKLGGRGAMVYVYYGMENIAPGRTVNVMVGQSMPRSRALLAGVNYRMPQISFQQLFYPRWAYGLFTEGIILRNGAASLKGFGAMMTVNYYSSGVFKGFWAMLGTGLYIANFESGVAGAGRDGICSLITQANIGWRFRLSDLTLGFGVGGQYFLDKTSQAAIGNGGILPIVLLDLGFVY